MPVPCSTLKLPWNKKERTHTANMTQRIMQSDKSLSITHSLSSPSLFSTAGAHCGFATPQCVAFLRLLKDTWHREKNILAPWCLHITSNWAVCNRLKVSYTAVASKNSLLSVKNPLDILVFACWVMKNRSFDFNLWQHFICKIELL